MSRKRVNWLKVGANTGVAFFSALGSTLTVDALCGHKIPIEMLLLASLMTGLIQAGLTLCREVAKVADKCEPGDGSEGNLTTKAQRHKEDEAGPERRGTLRCSRVQMVLTLLTLF